MKRWMILPVALITLAMASSALAAEGKPVIAVLDAQEVINKTNAAEEARAILKAETAKAQKQIDEMESSLVRRKSELEGKKSILSAEKYMEEEGNLRRAVREFRAEAQSIQEDLDRKNMQLRKDITEEIRQVVEELAAERGYQAVIAKNMLLFSADSVDISQDVLKRVNARVNAVSSN